MSVELHPQTMETNMEGVPATELSFVPDGDIIEDLIYDDEPALDQHQIQNQSGATQDEVRTAWTGDPQTGAASGQAEAGKGAPMVPARVRIPGAAAGNKGSGARTGQNNSAAKSPNRDKRRRSRSSSPGRGKQSRPPSGSGRASNRSRSRSRGRDSRPSSKPTGAGASASDHKSTRGQGARDEGNAASTRPKDDARGSEKPEVAKPDEAKARGAGDGDRKGSGGRERKDDVDKKDAEKKVDENRREGSKFSSKEGASGGSRPRTRESSPKDGDKDRKEGGQNVSGARTRDDNRRGGRGRDNGMRKDRRPASLRSSPTRLGSRKSSPDRGNRRVRARSHSPPRKRSRSRSPMRRADQQVRPRAADQPPKQTGFSDARHHISPPVYGGNMMPPPNTGIAPAPAGYMGPMRRDPSISGVASSSGRMLTHLVQPQPMAATAVPQKPVMLGTSIGTGNYGPMTGLQAAPAVQLAAQPMYMSNGDRMANDVAYKADHMVGRVGAPMEMAPPEMHSYAPTSHDHLRAMQQNALPVPVVASSHLPLPPPEVSEVIPPTLDQLCLDSTANIWYYLDPRGNKQGPYSLNQIRKWVNALGAVEAHERDYSEFLASDAWREDMGVRLQLSQILAM